MTGDEQWTITTAFSLLMIAITSVANYVAFRVGTKKDITTLVSDGGRRENNIGRLFESTDKLKDDKVNKEDCHDFRQTMNENISSLKGDVSHIRIVVDEINKNGRNHG